MIKDFGDIDIDCPDRDEILSGIKHVIALNGNTKHNTGVYFQDIPADAYTNRALIDYKNTFEYGFFKIDLLNVHLYKDVKSEDHLIELVNKEPDWNLLQFEEIVAQLFQVSQHFGLIKTLKPTSVEQLAAILAIIRPAKLYLKTKDWDTIMNEVWLPDAQGTYAFKKSHAISYALAIVVQLNLIVESTQK